jgi:diguanylate cyclase (GGDEF)-like protein
VEVNVESFVPFFLGLAVTAGFLTPLLLRLRAVAGEARGEQAAAVQQVAGLTRALSQREEDLRFLTQFLKDYPRLARELYSGLTERHVPAVLLGIVQRSLDPQHAVVLVKRAEGKGGTSGSPRLVVAAVFPENGAVRPGDEVPLEAGEIGFAVETQMVVSRQDLKAETAVGRIRPGGALAGMPRADLIAPLVFDQETLGVIVLQGARKSGDPKAALRLVAQTGAQVLHTAAQVTRMKATAELDGLTRVFNKKHLEQRLNELVYRAACAAYDERTSGQGGAGHVLSVFLFDIDNFKNYNDTNGHLAGDRLLQELAGLVQESVRKEDVFGRFGGEEFLLVMPHTSERQGLAAAEKIRRLIAERAFPYADRQPMGHLSVSGGVAAYPTHGVDAASLVHAADAALYEAKRRGRDRVLPAAAGPVEAAAAPAAAARS